ncbi:hypothetical protein LUW77_16675 [Streptomyces radiopugnans]|nr:hypothetical protein LUW77_16675 [Streptomyces radiopugnans]
MLAALVRRGDMVKARGQWQEVKAVRKQPHGSAYPTVTLIFATGPALRLRAGANVPTWRACQGKHR